MVAYKDIESMLKDARTHGREMNHEIISSDSHRNLTIGFACVSCKDCRWCVGLFTLKRCPSKLKGYFAETPDRHKLAKMLSFGNANEAKLNSLLK